MLGFDDCIKAVNLLYAPLGKLPKVNGSYLTNSISKKDKIEND